MEEETNDLGQKPASEVTQGAVRLQNTSTSSQLKNFNQKDYSTESNEAYLNEISTKVSLDLVTRIDGIQERITVAESDIENKIKQVEAQIEESKSKYVETLGLFVALFTFISVEFKFLQAAPTFDYTLSLTLLLAGLLIFFILVLDFVINNWRKKEDRETEYEKHYQKSSFGLFIVSIALIAIGILFIPVSKVFNAFFQLQRPSYNSTHQLFPISAPVSSPSATIIPSAK